MGTPQPGRAAARSAGVVVAEYRRQRVRRELRFGLQRSKLFVGILLGTRGNYAAVFPVPPSDIIDIWQPGRPEYDRLPGLPSS